MLPRIGAGALLLRRVALARRCLSTTPPPPPRKTWRQWVDERKHTLNYVLFSGTLVFVSLHLVNTRHKADDAQAELQLQLDKQDYARRLLVQSVPLVAREAGLPAAKQAEFETSLRSLFMQLDTNPRAVEEKIAAANPDDASRSPAAPAPAKQKAVW